MNPHTDEDTTWPCASCSKELHEGADVIVQIDDDPHCERCARARTCYECGTVDCGDHLTVADWERWAAEDMALARLRMRKAQHMASRGWWDSVGRRFFMAYADYDEAEDNLEAARRMRERA